MSTTATPSPPPALVGRATELAHVGRLLDAAAGGQGAACWLQGPAGSGKTALLEAVVADADRRGFVVRRLVGVEAESDLPWAALSSLCLPSAAEFDRLPGPQGRALRAAFALADEAGPLDRLAVALGTLGVLSNLARRAPALVVVDDVQWLDAESRQALELIARRLGDDPLVVLLAERTEQPDARTGSLPLEALADDAIDELVRRHGVHAPAAREAIVALAHGNPLWAIELAHGLSADERTGVRPVPPTLRTPASAEDLFRAGLEALEPAAARAVLVAAADGSGRTAVVEVALAELGGTLADLDPAEAAGLVGLDGGVVRFTHPLVRSAAYHAATAADRRAAHRALAAGEGPETPAGILHRAAAVTGADADLAEDLARLALDARRRGAPLTAATRYAQAAHVGGAPSRRCELLLGAASTASAAGDPQWAVRLVEEAREIDPERADQLDALRVQARLAVVSGRTDEAVRLADEAEARFAATEPVGVAEVLMDVARPLLSSDPVRYAGLAERAWPLAQHGDERIQLEARIVRGCGRVAAGPGVGGGAEDDIQVWRRLLDLAGPVAVGGFLADTVALYLIQSNRVRDALQLLDEVEPAIRAHAAPGALVSVLGARAFATYQRDLRACVAAAREALDLTIELDLPGLTPVTLATIAVAAAVVGDEALTTEITDRLLDEGSEIHEVAARSALGRLHLVLGQPERAVDQFARLRERIGPVNLSIMRFESDELEALVRAGRPAEAAASLPDLENAAPFGPWALAQKERGLGLLATDVDEAVAHFEAAHEALAQTTNRVAQANLELNWGEALRRAKRRAEARRHLERAVELFGRVGATGSRKRAEQELVAAGGTVGGDRPTAELLGDLELQVARMAAGGSTNRDIANQLFLSPRTVENHLSGVYRKLGVSGRAGLLARAAEDPSLRPTADQDAPAPTGP